MQRFVWRFGSIAAMGSLFITAFVLSISISVPTSTVYGQEPTATPRDPAWLAFSAARETIEAEENVDLTLVKNWTWYQDNWEAPNANHPQQARGIDNCLNDVVLVDAREVYNGWTFQITSLRNVTYTVRVSFDLRDVALCDIASAPAASAPADGDTASGDLPAPVASADIGGGFELGAHVDGLGPDAVANAKSAGMTWIKKQLPVAAGLQTGYNMINDAKNNGFRILLGVVAPRDDLVDIAAYAPGYATFVRALAEAGADAIEIHNEPNIDREWPTGQVSGSNYVQLLAPAYNAIKEVSPNTIVISGAPAPTGFFGAAGCAESGCNDDVFMQQMAAAGAANFMDCVGLHYNEGVMPPSASSGDPRGEFPTYYFGSMTARGQAPFPGKPVCYTELGYLSGEGMGQPIPAGFNWSPNDPVTVAEQAAWLAEAASIASTRNVRIMIVWNLNFTRWDSDPMGGFAMMRPDGTCPACGTLGAVMGGG